METKPNRFLELRSEETQELLTRPPAWWLRWGITLIFIVLCLITYGTWLIHYPDIIQAPFVLTSINAPKSVNTRTEGKLTSLLVFEGMYVKTDSPLAFMESTASHAEVLKLSEEINKIWIIANKGSLREISQLPILNYHHLGELQTNFQVFEQAQIKIRSYSPNGFHNRQNLILKEEILNAKRAIKNLIEQRNLQLQDADLAQTDINAQRNLAKLKAIPPLELLHEESKFILKKMPYYQTNNAIITNLSLIKSKEIELLESNKVESEQKNIFLQNLNTLRSSVDYWKSKYILSAPISGYVHFTKQLEANEFLTNNTELFYISPNANKLYGVIQIPQLNSGKVRLGQSVIIRFSAYPFQEYGLVLGKITSISEIPSKDGYFNASVSLPNKLTTSSGFEIPFKIGLVASADIVTKDKRIIEKLFQQLNEAIVKR